jgi:acyl CoA:acetate/3-ketoacid CoA transferase beta subunit
MIVTDLCVFVIDQRDGLVLIELAPQVTIDEIRAKTDAAFSESLQS